MTDIHIVWHSALMSSMEHCVVSDAEDGWRLESITVIPVGGEPGHIRHGVYADPAWRTRSAEVEVHTPHVLRFDVAVRDGQWTVNDTLRPDLAGCTDLDLGWTPATNLLPVRRLGLDVGASATIDAAWLRFPEFEFVRTSQTYTRVHAHVWRYRSSTYEAELEVNDTGLVTRYGADVWRAIAYQV